MSPFMKRLEIANKIMDVISRFCGRDCEMYAGECDHFGRAEGAVYILTDWNRVEETLGGKKAAAIEAAAVKHDISMEYNDEYTSCSECGCAIRTAPTHYGWRPAFIYTDDGIICRCCIENLLENEDKECLEELLDLFIDDSDTAVDKWMIPMLKYVGFKCLEDDDMACDRFETGFHPGQNDDPDQILKDVKEKLPNHEIIFVINNEGQFDVHWSVYIREVHKTYKEIPPIIMKS